MTGLQVLNDSLDQLRLLARVNNIVLFAVLLQVCEIVQVLQVISGDALFDITARGDIISTGIVIVMYNIVLVVFTLGAERRICLV